MEAAVGPDRRHAAEDLVPADVPPAVDPLGRRRRQQQRHVVPGLTVDGGEDLTLGRPLEDEPARLVPRPQQIGGEPGPVDVHVHAERRRRGDVAEAPRQLRVAEQAEAGAPVLGRQRAREVAGRAELGEVLLEEAVVTVVLRRPLVEAGQHLVGQQGVDRCRRCDRFAGGHGCPSSSFGALGANGSGVWTWSIVRSHAAHRSLHDRGASPVDCPLPSPHPCPSQVSCAPCRGRRYARHPSESREIARTNRPRSACRRPGPDQRWPRQKW